MQSDPKQCLYCTNNQTLHDLMIEICPLKVSRAFLFKEQTYRGRCLVAYNGHVNDLNELSELSTRRKSTMVLTATSFHTCISIWHRNMSTAPIMAARSR